MKELIIQGRDATKLEKPCFRYKKNILYVQSNYMILQPPSIWLLLLIGLDI